MAKGTDGALFDAPALEALFARLERPLFNVVYRWVWSAEEARDVTQETFLKLWSARARIDTATVDALAFRIALNLAANRSRRRKWFGWLSDEQRETTADERALPSDALEKLQTQRRVRDAINALPEKLKAVVVLCELSELSYQDVAKTLEIPIGTVGSRRSLALAALEKSLGEPFEVSA